MFPISSSQKQIDVGHVSMSEGTAIMLKNGKLEQITTNGNWHQKSSIFIKSGIVLWITSSCFSLLAGILLLKGSIFNLKEDKKNKSNKNEHKNLIISKLISVLLAIGWTIAAQLILSLIALPLSILISWMIGLKFILWAPEIRMTYELLLTAGFNITISLVLLFTTKNVQPLNRSMLWVLTGWAVWHLLNASLPVLGMKPIYYDSFFFYNIKELNGWFFTTGLLVNAIGSISGIALYLIWKRRKNRFKPDLLTG
ncbi:MAG: hypothetical protein GY705_08470 [Bacteroidetes bacterium]|nr:hypothetical protein [Bacteroidota bacterium]